MTHEMFHVAFPSMDDGFSWLQEGLASYLEPLARVRLGLITPEKVWFDFVDGMPQGQPAPGDMGLNHIEQLTDPTQRWGRTYWGGVMFCIQCDLRIRERTHDRRSLDDAMRAILAAGGDHLHQWTIERVLDVGDRATGTNVMHEVYAEMADHPVTVDLTAFWRRLGVINENGRIRFDDSAPLAAIRRAMTAPVHRN